ncbi:2,3-bisphosphoglycerate-independent phosphoglycerate mutase, partial [Candidatus Uhrbacteria bacterium]|nr:2,3-bisphosphoglycerate-independent phosphoglycerate mutase [Candidatus Uhrbacteria bacterium]MBD3284298.1 2,3-bisphosphoglycerate-independent phosphoglycerate mutase [Candidatus Uhrbacteria bacterium]
MPLTARPIVLIVLDGFGIAPPENSNAITLAQKPYFDSLLKEYPSMLLEASGLNVGLPRNEVGNSEVGHVTIGSGILRYQSLPRIDKSIEDGEFQRLPGLLKIKEKIASGNRKLHLMGLIGNGGVHASEKHLQALINWTKEQKIWNKTFIHAFLDGRDTGKDTGSIFMKELQEFMKDKGKIATFGGRFFGMDRNLNWDRIQKAYDAIVFGKSESTCKDPLKQLKEFYRKEIYDEEVPPTVVTGKGDAPIATIEDGDCVIYFNFRADRGRQMTEALVEPAFQ